MKYYKNANDFKASVRQKGFYETTTLPSHQHLSDEKTRRC